MQKRLEFIGGNLLMRHLRRLMLYPVELLARLSFRMLLPAKSRGFIAGLSYWRFSISVFCLERNPATLLRD
jgi:hypothetical protein